jgi:riboflavin-specific deaminase-like protein
MPVIDENYAWRLIQDALNIAPGAPLRPVDAASDAPQVTYRVDGGWQTQAEVTPAARDLLDALLPVACSGESFVIAQIGQSLDGRIATETGHSHYVTGEVSRVHLHRLRALVDAVIVGAGTVAADDPQLTVRHVDGRNPLRVVLDPRSRLAADRRVFCDAAAPTLHLVNECSAAAPVPQAVVDSRDGRVAPAAILELLAARGLRRVLVEGGGVTVSRFLEAGLLDRLHVVVAPLIIGSGRPAITLAPIERLDTALRPPARSQRMGDDLFYDLDLRDLP